jgi:hypothetical protein
MIHAAAKDPELKRFYRRKLIQKGMGKARIAAACKLGIRQMRDSTGKITSRHPISVFSTERTPCNLLVPSKPGRSRHAFEGKRNPRGGYRTIVLCRLFDNNTVRTASFRQQRQAQVLPAPFRAVNLPANRCVVLSQLPVPTAAQRPVGSQRSLFFCFRKLRSQTRTV